MIEVKNCKTLLGSLSDYVDGIAQEDLCREIEQHLSECEDCRIVVDTLRKTIYLYHATSTMGLPMGVRERLFIRLNLEDFLKTQ